MLSESTSSQHGPTTKNPPWNREELLLALELYMRNRKSPPSKTSREVQSLSKELNRLRARIGRGGSSSFRNANGVYLKMMNFRSYDPDYTSQGKVGMRHGTKLDAVVWNEFVGKEGELFKACRAIREALKELPEDFDADSEDDGFAEAAEGKLLTRLHKRRERSVKLVKAKKKWAMKKFGGLECEACGFNFVTRYGERGQGFIECHHTQPVHEYGDGRKTTTEDLALLCANCHRIIHSKRPWLSLEELKVLLRLIAMQEGRDVLASAFTPTPKQT
jgi:5-methylcytosine-specific restriction enzyme A